MHRSAANCERVFYLHEDKHVERIIVLAESLRYEPVVVGVYDAAVEDAIHVKKSCGLVKLVLDLGSTRNFNHGME